MKMSFKCFIEDLVESTEKKGQVCVLRCVFYTKTLVAVIFVENDMSFRLFVWTIGQVLSKFIFIHISEFEEDDFSLFGL